jgi:hypothetical protein
MSAGGVLAGVPAIDSALAQWVVQVCVRSWPTTHSAQESVSAPRCPRPSFRAQVAVIIGMTRLVIMLLSPLKQVRTLTRSGVSRSRPLL